MGYDVFQFGALNLDDKIQPVPQKPLYEGDIPEYDGKAAISIGSSEKGEGITWIKPDGCNFLIADRVLLTNVSWEDLNKSGFVKGNPILVDRQYFNCRLLQVGKHKNASNEWDKALDETGKDNLLWHWYEMYFWGADVSVCEASMRAVRGWVSACYWGNYSSTVRYLIIGFRPVLEPLPSDNPIPNINLDGEDFQLTSFSGSDTFCPILQPTRADVFKDIPAGSKVRMYTLMENGHPIHMEEPVKDTSKLTLTDRYFGDEFLVSWAISNGMAVVSRSLKQQI